MSFETPPTGDNHEQFPQLSQKALGDAAEDAVIEAFEKSFPNLTIRLSTKKEDSGVKQIARDLAIDAVVYADKKPVMTIQVTASTDSKVRHDKSSELTERPFVRLDEMKPQDRSIPKVLVFMHPEHVKSFVIDHDLTKHPEVLEDIKRGISNSLALIALKTKDPIDRKNLSNLQEIFQ